MRIHVHTLAMLAATVLVSSHPCLASGLEVIPNPIQAPVQQTVAPIDAPAGSTLRSSEPYTGPLFPGRIYAYGLEPTATAIGDLDGDGQLDLVIGTTESATGRRLSVWRNSTVAGGAIAFDAPLEVEAIDPASRLAPAEIQIADFDGDGRLDIVVSHSGTSVVSVLRNRSEPGTIAFDTRDEFTICGGPQIGDFNGDGRPDLLSVCSTGSATTYITNVLLNTSSGPGSLSFAEPVETLIADVAYFVYFLRIGDLNGDGNDDLVHVEYQRLRVSLGLGDGTFTAPVEYETVDDINGIALGDLDGDGFPDLALTTAIYDGTTNAYRSSMTVMFNLGDGTFAAQQTYPLVAYPYIVRTSDVDVDGRLDLVLWLKTYDGTSGGFVSVRRNLGDGTLAPSVEYTCDLDPFLNTTIAIGDLNGDSAPDLVIPFYYKGFFFGHDADSLIVLQNVGDGTFAARVEYDTRDFRDYETDGPSSVAAGDLNGDDAPDLVTTYQPESRVDVWLNRSSGAGDVAFVPAATLLNVSIPAGVAIADLDRDSHADIVMWGRLFQGTYSYGLVVLRNQGDGTFAAPISVNGVGGAIQIAVADLDGDGRQDVVVDTDDSRISVHRNTSSGPGVISFAPPIDFGSGIGLLSVAIDDLDGDTRPDLAVMYRDTENLGTTLAVLRNTSAAAGTIAFANQVNYSLGLGVLLDRGDVSIGDLDGDNSPDIVVTNSDPGYLYIGRVSVFRNWGDGTLANPLDFFTGVRAASVAITDVNSDGRADLAVANSQRQARAGGQSVSILLNTSSGPGTIAFAPKDDYATAAGPVSVVAEDFDQDGNPDLALTYSTGTIVSVLRNQTPPVAPPICPGDADGDRRVNFDDLTTVLVNFGDPTSAFGPGDADGSGQVNFDDLTTVLANFGNSCMP